MHPKKLSPLLACVGTWLMASTVHAQYYVSMPDLFLNDPPKYYSGTNCTVSFKVEGTGPDEFSAIDLYLNNEHIKHYDYPIINGQRITETSVGANFDSTHFVDGSTITPKIIVSLRYSPSSPATYSAPAVTVKNSAVVFGRHDFETTYSNGDGARATHTALPSLGIDSDPGNWVDFAGWNAQDYYASLYLGSPSVVYTNTHSVGQQLESDYDESSSYNPNNATDLSVNLYINSTNFNYGSVLNSRQAAMGTGRPPFNSSGNPPIWFAWNNACLTGFTNNFGLAFLWPYTNYYNNNYCENQAEMAWVILEPIAFSRTGAQRVWEDFGSGYTVDDARVCLYDSYLQWCDDNNVTVQPAPDPVDAARSSIHVWGDLYTRVHGVYTGTPGIETGWYR